MCGVVEAATRRDDETTKSEQRRRRRRRRRRRKGCTKVCVPEALTEVDGAQSGRSTEWTDGIRKQEDGEGGKLQRKERTFEVCAMWEANKTIEN